MVIGALLAAMAIAALAGPAGARTNFVSGQQVPLATTTIMRGDLIGTWTYTATGPLITGFPLYHWTGTERFEGCLNLHRDQACRHDPRGTLSFSYDAWVQAAGADPDTATEVWGACVHPITGGTGAFAGAQGVLTMIDTPMPDGVVTTRYDGNLVLPDQPRGDAPQSAFRNPFAAASTGAAGRGC
jgi:hypothetical protein